MSSVAPAVLPDQGITTFIQVGGSELPLPHGARKDLSYQYEYDPRGASNINAFNIEVPGNVYEIPLSFRATLTTDGTVGGRGVRFSILNASDITVAATLAITTQHESASFDYFGLVGLSYPPAPVITEMQLPLPAFVVPPGWHHKLATFGVQGALDAWTVETFTVIRIPTGPALFTAADLTLTPLLV